MGIMSSEQYAYYQRVNAARERKEAFKKAQRERALKEYGRRNAEKWLSCIVWYKAPGEGLKKAQIKEGGTTLRRILGSFEEICLGDGLKVLYNPQAKEFGFSENCEVSGIKICGPAVLCNTLGWEFTDCKLSRADAEKYFC